MRLFLLLAWLLVGSPIFAQNIPSIPLAGSLLAAQAAPDTAAAIHRLFVGRRHRRNAIAIGLGVGLVLNIIDASLTANDAAANRPSINLGSAPSNNSTIPNSGTPVSTTWLLAVLPTSSLIVLDYLVYAGFSCKQEARAIQAYRAGKLPTHLRNKLRAKHFRPVAFTQQ